MKTFLVSAMAIGAMTSMALAGPVELTDKQMDNVTAGTHLLEVDVGDVTVVVPVNAAVNACAVIAACVQTATATQERPGRAN